MEKESGRKGRYHALVPKAWVKRDISWKCSNGGVLYGPRAVLGSMGGKSHFLPFCRANESRPF